MKLFLQFFIILLGTSSYGYDLCETQNPTCAYVYNGVHCGYGCKYVYNDVYCADSSKAKCSYVYNAVYCGIDCKYIYDGVYCADTGRAEPATPSTSN